jgi:catechol 2,3-dioxygenase-like lactoylglutathione lyase family enzyme
MMPFQRRISAVVCSTDLERSRDFYERVVGLPLSSDTVKNHLVFDCADGTTLLVYGRPAPGRADHTQVRFWTADVEADVADLAGRGVVFDEFDLGTLKTVNGVATSPGLGRSAWFKDPDGNTLALFEPEASGA